MPLDKRHFARTFLSDGEFTDFLVTRVEVASSGDDPNDCFVSASFALGDGYGSTTNISLVETPGSDDYADYIDVIEKIISQAVDFRDALVSAREEWQLE